MSITTETRFESLTKLNSKTICNSILKIMKEKTDVTSGIGLTSREVAEELYLRGIVKENSRQQVAPRITELRDKCLITVVGKKYDSYSDRNVASYALRT